MTNTMTRMIRRRRIPIRYRKYKAKGLITPKGFAIISILLIFALLISYSLGKSSARKTQAKVIEVIDGDTIVVQSGEEKVTVRILGVDTPEVHHPTKPVECFGEEASNFSKNLLQGAEVQLEYDVERYDKYARTLAYVYLDGKRFNDLLIEKGFAKLLVIKPNTKYAHTLLVKEVDAKNSKKGLWGSC